MTGEIMMKSLFEQNGGTYRTKGDYRLPNLALPDKPVFYVNLLTSGKLKFTRADGARCGHCSP